MGAKCIADWECLGLLKCGLSGQCEGHSGCSDFCYKSRGGRVVNCCVAESLSDHRCTSDDDCLGARTCDLAKGGVCTGDSGCHQGSSSKLKVTYDLECLCLGIDNTCLFPDGIPCSKLCHYSRRGDLASCSLT